MNLIKFTITILLTLFYFSLFLISLVINNAFSETLLIQSSTALRDSGLYAKILPIFEMESGVKIIIIAVGSGQALENARKGNGDVVITHDPIAEKKFISQGYAKKRIAFAYTYYQIIGPKEDFANLGNAGSINDAMLRLANSKNKPIFISRGDNSGTHRKEIKLWQEININPKDNNRLNYVISGAGMAKALNLADQLNAYTLTDTATFLILKNNFRLKVLLDTKSKKLKNIYSLITLQKTRNQKTKQIIESFASWLTSDAVQTLISNYSINGVTPYKGILN